MRSVSPSGDEASQYFWSPNQGDTLEAEEQRGGPTAKIMMYDLLILLCKKAEWLERNLADTLPQMFKEHDKDLDGMISRFPVARCPISSCVHPLHPPPVLAWDLALLCSEKLGPDASATLRAFLLTSGC